MPKVWILVALSVALAACGGGSSAAPPTVTPPPPPEFKLGDPLEDLTPTERAAFERGRDHFLRRFRPSEGLGPFYNATSCVSCHSTPAEGGSSRLYRNFYLAMYGPPTHLEPLPPFLGPVVPAYGTGLEHTSATFSLEGGRTVIPDSFFGWPVVTAQRNALPIYGVGLFEFVSDATIMANADPFDTDGDGVSGRYNTDAGALGRFGTKAQSNNIERFTRGPLQNQMGVTTLPFLGKDGTVGLPVPVPVHAQVSADPDDPTIDHDGVPDPELGRADLGDLIAYSRFLAPPRRVPFDQQATRGEATFDRIGCTKCHIPSLPSSRGPVEAYTDLLLHDMGEELADGMTFGLPQVAPEGRLNGSEWRTQPLWGVRLHGPWLHDGRAETILEAILLHGGEAQAIREAFEALSPGERADVVAFLEHL